MSLLNAFIHCVSKPHRVAFTALLWSIMLNISRISFLSRSLKSMGATQATLYDELHSIQFSSGISAQPLTASFVHCWWSPQKKNMTTAQAKLVTWVLFNFSCLAYFTSSARSFSKMVAFLTLTSSQINVELASDGKASS